MSFSLLAKSANKSKMTKELETQHTQNLTILNLASELRFLDKEYIAFQQRRNDDKIGFLDCWTSVV